MKEIWNSIPPFLKGVLFILALAAVMLGAGLLAGYIKRKIFGE